MLDTKPIHERLGEDHLKGVGMIAAEWEYMSVMLRALVGSLAGMKEPAISITLSRVSTPQLLDWAVALSEWRPTGETQRLSKHTTEAIKELATRINELREKRNETVHAVWMLFGLDQGEHYIYRQSGRRTFKTEFIPKTPEDLKKVAEEIAQATKAVRDLLLDCTKQLR